MKRTISILGVFILISVTCLPGCISKEERQIYRYVDRVFPSDPDKDTCIIDIREVLGMDYDDLYSIYQPLWTDFLEITGIPYPPSLWNRFVEFFYTPTSEDLSYRMISHWEERKIFLIKDSCLISSFVNNPLYLNWNLKTKVDDSQPHYYGHDTDGLYVVERTYRVSGLFMDCLKSKYRLTPVKDYSESEPFNSIPSLVFYPTTLTYFLPIVKRGNEEYISYCGNFGELYINYNRGTAILHGLPGWPTYYGRVDIQRDSLFLHFDSVCNNERHLSELMGNDAIVKESTARTQTYIDDELEQYFSQNGSVETANKLDNTVLPPTKVLKNKQGDYLVIQHNLFELTHNSDSISLLGSYCIKKVYNHWEIQLQPEYISTYDDQGRFYKLTPLDMDDFRRHKRILKISRDIRSLVDITDGFDAKKRKSDVFEVAEK